MFKSKNPNDVRLAFEYADKLTNEQKYGIAEYLWGAYALMDTFGSELFDLIDSWRFLTKNKENEIK